VQFIKVMPITTLNALAEGSTIRSEPGRRKPARDLGFSRTGVVNGWSGKTSARETGDCCVEGDLRGPYQKHYVKLDRGGDTLRGVLYSGHAGNRNPGGERLTFKPPVVKRVSGRHQPGATVPTVISTTCDYYDHESAINSYERAAHSYGNTDNFPKSASMFSGADVPNTIYSYLKQTTGLDVAARVDEPFRTFHAVKGKGSEKGGGGPSVAAGVST